MLTRRSFLPLLAAPAVLKLGVYMPVSSANVWIKPKLIFSGPYAMIYNDGTYFWKPQSGGLVLIDAFGAEATQFGRIAIV